MNMQAPVTPPAGRRPDFGRLRPLRPSPPNRRARADHAFLPAALEILESPPSPVGVFLIWIICLLVVAALTWGYFGRIDVIAVAQGKIQPTGRVKVIQPLESGRIAELRVHDGQTVAKGEVLAILDSGEADADVHEMTASFTASQAEAARRRAARSAVDLQRRDATSALTTPSIEWPADIPDAVKARETRVLESDLGQLAADVASLQAQQAQKRRERDRYAATSSALTALVATLQERVDARATLTANGSGSKGDLINAKETLQMQQAALATATGQIAESEAAAAVFERSIAASYRTFANTNEQKLAEAERQADELRQRLAKARVRQHRMALASPIDGTVSALSITAAGQVAAAGEEIMRIVPDGIGIEIEAYVLNRDIGFVHPGQEAIVKIESLPFTRYGTINATLARVASDAIPEPDANSQEGNPGKALASQGFAGAQRTQNLVFAATFKPDAISLAADGGIVPLSPGMAVTVEIKTGSRRILEYIFSPLVEVASKALKER